MNLGSRQLLRTTKGKLAAGMGSERPASVLNIGFEAWLRNLMVSRVCLYILILTELCLPWCLEQPTSSLLEAHPLFVFLAQKYKIFKDPQLHCVARFQVNEFWSGLGIS